MQGRFLLLTWLENPAQPSPRCLRPPQVIAFNLGSLGFLTNFNYSDFERDLANVIRGSAKLDSCSFASENLDEPSVGQLGEVNCLEMKMNEMNE